MEGQWPDMCQKQPSWATIDERGKQEGKKGKRFSMDILFYGQHDCVQGPLELIGAIKGKKGRKNKAGRCRKSKQWPKGKEDS